MKRKLVILFISLTFVFLGGAWDVKDPSFHIIVNISNPVSSLTKSQISRFFLKKEPRWEKGDKVQPVDLTGESSIREDFSKTIHGRKISAIKAYWQKQIFSGRSVPPPEKIDNTEVFRYVKSHPGAIGYVSKAFSVDGVKVLIMKE